MHTITILGKPGCHLCDVAKQEIYRLVSSHADVLVTEINILDNPDLHAKYNDDVPVILVDNVERFRHTVDPDKLAKIFYDQFGQSLLGF